MITYRKYDHLEVIGYTDSDFANCMDTRISEFVIQFMNRFSKILSAVNSFQIFPCLGIIKL